MYSGKEIGSRAVAPGLLIRALTAVVILLAAILLVACGDDEGDELAGTTAVTDTVTAPTPAEEGGGAGGEPGSADGSFEPGDTDVGELTGFTSPTGRIGCLIEVRSVRCDISERDWEPPEPPDTCAYSYGQGLMLKAGAAAEFVCAGDTALQSGKPLPYGRSISAGSLLCESARSGMSCTDRETGRGFSISRERYEIF